MFKVSERRKPTKSLPGRLFVSIIKSTYFPKDNKELDAINNNNNNDVNIYDNNNNNEYKQTYVSLKYKAHDSEYSICALKEVRQTHNDIICVYSEPGAAYSHEFDICHHNWQDDYILMELWDSFQMKTDFLDFELNSSDKLLGSIQIPIIWILNGFGSGWQLKSRSSWQGSLRMGQSDHPWRVELRASYQSEFDSDIQPPQCMCSQRAQKRFTTVAFNGTYRLDAEHSDSIDKLLAEAEAPFVLHKLDAGNTEERIKIEISQGGNAIAFTTANAFYKQSSGDMLVDGPFQSVPTHRGTLVEKRLYWDFSSMQNLIRFTPYLSPVLMIITRIGPNIPNVIEAWQISDDKNTLTQLSQVDGMKERYKRIWQRIPTTIPPLIRRPKVMTIPGTLHIAILKGSMFKSAPPNENAPITAYAALKLQQFSNDDKRYMKPLGSGKERQTRFFENDPNPKWNQVFKFDVIPRHGIHSLIILEVWNRLKNEDDLLGNIRISVPWVYNGCGIGLGPNTFEYYQATYKLRRGDILDPTLKGRYFGGRITLRMAFVPRNIEDQEFDVSESEDYSEIDENHTGELKLDQHISDDSDDDEKNNNNSNSSSSSSGSSDDSDSSIEYN